MKYKKGTKIRALKTYTSYYTGLTHWTEGKIYKLIEDTNGEYIRIKDDTYGINGINNELIEGYYTWFEFITEQPANEIEWLNRVQENFKT